MRGKNLFKNNVKDIGLTVPWKKSGTQYSRPNRRGQKEQRARADVRARGQVGDRDRTCAAVRELLGDLRGDELVHGAIAETRERVKEIDAAVTGGGAAAGSRLGKGETAERETSEEGSGGGAAGGRRKSGLMRGMWRSGWRQTGGADHVQGG